MFVHLLRTSCWFVLIFGYHQGRSQEQFLGLEHLFTSPKSYQANYATKPLTIDGLLQEESWQKAAWTDLFIDIEGAKRPAPPFSTKVKMLWDDTHLYVAAELEEPHLWATLRNHDDIVFHDNDFEIFIDPDNDTHQYFEIEVNALNTIFDLFLPKPYRNGSGALISWNAGALKSAIKVNGTLNDPRDKDQGWSVEMAIPWRAISVGNNVNVPNPGDYWRINFSRVQWETEIKDGKYVKKTDANGKKLPENNWVWSPQGVINMHFPERWGYLQFAKHPTDLVPGPLHFEEDQRKYLWLIYYRQKEYFKNNRKYAATLPELGISPEVLIAGKPNQLHLESSANLFRATIVNEGKGITIDHDGQIKRAR